MSGYVKMYKQHIARMIVIPKTYLKTNTDLDFFLAIPIVEVKLSLLIQNYNSGNLKFLRRKYQILIGTYQNVERDEDGCKKTNKFQGCRKSLQPSENCFCLLSLWCR